MLLQTHEIRRSRPLLGTFVEIAITNSVDAEAVLDEAFDVVSLVHRLMSFHDSSSDVSRLNEDAWKKAVTVHPWTYQVLEAAIDLQRRSQGIFNIDIASVLQSSGLLPGVPFHEQWTQPFNRESVILLPDYRVLFLHPDVRIDLGGIAKGFAVDRAVDVLLNHEIEMGIVNAGGDIRCFGEKEYQIGVRHPKSPDQLVSLPVLKNQAIATSAHCYQTRSSSHIDGITRQPLQKDFSVSVKAETCLIADALTKVVLALGEESTAVLDEYKAGAFILYPDDRIIQWPGEL